MYAKACETCLGLRCLERGRYSTPQDCPGDLWRLFVSLADGQMPDPLLVLSAISAISLLMTDTDRPPCLDCR